MKLLIGLHTTEVRPVCLRQAKATRLFFVLEEMKMATFLLLWNPVKWAWAEFDSGVVGQVVRTDGGYDEPWTTGTRSKGIVPGDRVFLLKTGLDPRGLVAAGVARSAIYAAPHWDESRSDLAPHVDVLWTGVLDTQNPIPYDIVRSLAPSLPQTVMGGGVRVDDAGVEALESLWASHQDTDQQHAPGVRLQGRLVTRAGVLSVLDEYAQLGQDDFLDKYGFQRSRRFWLQHEGKLYESKAVLGVAAGLRPSDFSGGESTVSRLSRLGFTVLDVAEPNEPEPETPRPAFVARDPSVDPSPRQPGQADPDSYGRGLKSHRWLENWLADRVRQAGLSPQDPAPDDPQFDLAWETGAGLTVVEVKSITSANETHQIRLGLGQVLEYAFLLSTPAPVRPVLFLEREPSSHHWGRVCESVGVDLWWPALLDSQHNLLLD